MAEDILIKVDLPEKDKEPEPQATVSLKIRKSLEGNLIITDHEDIDIVVIPAVSDSSWCCDVPKFNSTTVFAVGDDAVVEIPAEIPVKY